MSTMLNLKFYLPSSVKQKSLTSANLAFVIRKKKLGTFRLNNIRFLLVTREGIGGITTLSTTTKANVVLTSPIK